MAYQSRAPNHTTEENSTNRRLYNPYQDLSFPTQTLYNLPTSPKFLFQEESVAQRRSWGENLTYYTGIGYLAAATAGAAKGLATGVKSIEAINTLKLKINRILNGSGHTGRQIGNRPWPPPIRILLFIVLFMWRREKEVLSCLEKLSRLTWTAKELISVMTGYRF